MLTKLASRRRSHRRRRDERGFSLVLMSLILVSLLGIAGLVVDLGSWQVQASKAQQAADAAALGGVVRLPDGFGAARARALEIAKDNGFDDAAPDVIVTVTSTGNETLEVSVTRTEIKRYFSQVVRNTPVNVTRRSTAQYVQPVPLGSPRNYLGTNRLPIGVTGDGVENFYLAISGKCTRREYGDRITPRAMNNPSSPHGCTPGTNGALANPEHSDNGYLFGITVPPGGSPTAVQIFDGAVCTGSGSSFITHEDRTPFDTRTTLRHYDDLDPYAGTLVPSVPVLAPNPRLFVGASNTSGDCAFSLSNSGDRTCVGSGTRECWTTIGHLPGPGEYTLQVNPVFRDAFTGHNNFALRTKRTGSSFSPCTSDTAVRDGLLPATPGYTATCAQVYGLEHLPIVASGTTDPSFFLSSIDSRHNGKTMQVTLYDSAEGAGGISLIDPSGGVQPVSWEVLCADGGQPSGGSCTGEANPTGGRSGGPVNTVNVAGNGTQPFPNNVQRGKYSDRLLRLSFQLPSDIDAAYGGRTWWKIRYTPASGGSFGGDRTTWSVKLLGDPVRIIPNSPPTTVAGP